MFKYALLGTGRQASRLVSAMQSLGGELIALYSRNKEKARFFLGNAPNNGIFVSEAIDEVIIRNGVEAVIIATPDFLHYEHTKKSLLSGKHVYLEKPLATKVTEGKEIIQISQNKNLVLYVGYHLRQLSILQNLRRKYLDGYYGKINSLNISWGHLPISISDWRNSLNPWWCASVLGTHCLDLILWFLNSQNNTISNYYGVADNCTYQKSDDSVCMKLSFKENTVATISCTLAHDSPLTLDIESERGSYRYSNFMGDQTLVDFDEGTETFSYTNPWSRTLMEFHEAINKHLDVTTLLNDSLKNIELLTALRIK